MMDKRTRGCLWAGLGVAVLLVVVGAAVVGGAAWIIYQGSAVEHGPTTEGEAKARFDEVRRRFHGQAPLVTFDADGGARVRRRTTDGSSTPALESFHAMVWKPRERELARMQLPFWLVRLGGSRGKIDFGPELGNLERLDLSMDDFERAGPGVVLDHQEDDGTQILLWTE
jgi:hypothetical protein